MENLVVTKDIAEKLKINGFKQRAAYWWNFGEDAPAADPSPGRTWYLQKGDGYGALYAAPTVQEISYELPPYMLIKKGIDDYMAWLRQMDDIDAMTASTGSSMAEALAALWLRLKGASNETN